MAIPRKPCVATLGKPFLSLQPLQLCRILGSIQGQLDSGVKPRRPVLLVYKS